MLNTFFMLGIIFVSRGSNAMFRTRLARKFEHGIMCNSSIFSNFAEEFRTKAVD